MIQNQNSKASEKYLVMSKELSDSSAWFFSTLEKLLSEYNIRKVVWIHEIWWEIAQLLAYLISDPVAGSCWTSTKVVVFFIQKIDCTFFM